jgi:hypothetical protein
VLLIFLDNQTHAVFSQAQTGCATSLPRIAAPACGLCGSARFLDEVATAPGARTSFFMPETGTLYVAVPHRGKQEAQNRVFNVAPAK